MKTVVEKNDTQDLCYGTPNSNDGGSKEQVWFHEEKLVLGTGLVPGTAKVSRRGWEKNDGGLEAAREPDSFPTMGEVDSFLTMGKVEFLYDLHALITKKKWSFSPLLFGVCAPSPAPAALVIVISDMKAESGSGSFNFEVWHISHEANRVADLVGKCHASSRELELYTNQIPPSVFGLQTNLHH
ncbi:hypothetical protein V6N11_043019 [Hibiscus sabdariffa]|uniref:RNase H type-1 domain-containing protein n=1 Tax=Hibiscus sabdariffa TaxID=183260 RepID=A0ABR2QY27_9ROSI